MGGEHNFYEGSQGLSWASYGLGTYEDELFQGFNYRTPASTIGIATDPRSANQLKAVADKLSTGTKVIEFTAIQANVLESIPDQHLEEINRLRQLAGVELTFHGPIVEPTGISKEGWDEARRMQAERQMWSAVERSHKLDPEGNVIVTFHSSAGLPELESKYKTEKGEQVSEMWVIDEREGKFASLKPRELHMTKEFGEPRLMLEKLNKENWERALSQASFHAQQGYELVEGLQELAKEKIPKELRKELEEVDLLNLYKKARTSEGQSAFEKLSPQVRKHAESIFNKLNHGELYVRDSYNELQNLFDQAYDVAQREKDDKTLTRLNSYREEIASSIKKENLEDPAQLAKLAEEVTRGIRLLSVINPPKVLKPFNDFAVDKASDTFANIALKAYDKFKDSAPIISIENPPAGSGLSRAEDLRKVVEEARKKFAEKAHEELGLSAAEAARVAEKQIGVTWDVGHINMLRKYGYEDKELAKETEKIAKLVKHVHLSDNFGLEHTELPMGMGNVPIKKHMELLEQYNKKLKKIAETGDWYQHFKRSPLPETLAALGSPIYGMVMAPSWNNAGASFGGYFAGYGMNPDIHHSIYGAGFANLPVELGGQMAGRNRLSGAPME